MMIEHNLKPCPLCGGRISLEAVCQTPQERRVHMRCSRCWMEFLHTQHFNTMRRPIGRSFEEIWDGRADHAEA